MKSIFLNDLLGFSEDDFGSIKLKFNVWDGETDPHELYKQSPEIINENWLLWKKEKYYYYEGETVINFIGLGDDAWLLTCVKKIESRIDVDESIGYKAKELKKYEKYFGRVIVQYHKSSRSTVFKYENFEDDLEVLQILHTKYEDDEFPGYENVRLSYTELQSIIDRKKQSWIAALENQKAVYLITDTKTGKLYVGSATSQTGMLLQRWKNYVADGTGGNVGLEELKKKKDFDYIQKYFQYSILENYNARMDDDYILKRESWWKETLKSREFGYNKN